ncbi:hypothetical protein WJX73_009104 [Symbiochloris irregularis]|uniref:Uncharacterized protein n=1 Tax=Symbiochloris irregularis TaxID=706552 RepID=A0AAW1PHL0_9CHLO
MARFALPALSIPLAEPLMSLVDSVAVAQGVNGSRDLAALGPNSLIFSFFTYVFSALSIATVSVMTELMQQDERQTASRVLSAALLIALLGGVLILVVMKVYGKQMLAATGCSAVLQGPAWEYMRVRAVAMPTALMLMVAQAGLLAQRDSIRPFLAVVAQVSANIAGDYWLVIVMGTGIAGAAWATVASQALGCLLAIGALQFTAEVRLHTGLPKRSDMLQLATTFGPASFIYLCKNLCYIMLQGAAAILPPLQLAAHQGAWALWSLTSFAQSPVEQAALAFLPAQPQGSQRRNAVGVILMLGAVLGLVTSCMCSGILLFLPRLLTPDPQLWPFMAAIVPQAFVAVILAQPA